MEFSTRSDGEQGISEEKQADFARAKGFPVELIERDGSIHRGIFHGVNSSYGKLEFQVLLAPDQKLKTFDAYNVSGIAVYAAEGHIR
jgi:hypothetical protein